MPNNLAFLFRLILLVQSAYLLQSCNVNPGKASTAVVSDSLAEAQKHFPENALKGLKLANGLEVKSVAVEPMLKNPTNIDVDERGRIWVVEAYNYRSRAESHD